MFFVCFPSIEFGKIGKTTTATLVAKEDGRHIVEFNASDVRSKKALQNAIGDLTGSQGISFANMKKRSDSTKKAKPYIQKRCIIMDEVDGMGKSIKFERKVCAYFHYLFLHFVSV